MYNLHEVIRLKSPESFLQLEGLSQDEIDNYNFIRNESQLNSFQIFDIIEIFENNTREYIILSEDDESYIVTDNMIEEKIND